LALSGVAAVLLVYACKKNDAHPVTRGTTVSADTIHISSPIDSGTELIVSEPSGTVLLDTIFSTTTNFRAALSSPLPFVDVTLIQYYSYSHTYQATTYKTVNPSTWTSLMPGSYSVPVSKAGYSTGDLTYLLSPGNLPIFPRGNGPNYPDSGIYISSIADQGPYSMGFSFYNYPPYPIASQYWNYGNYRIFMLWTANGLYNFYTPKTLHDTVQDPVMDTAEIIRPVIPAEFNQVIPQVTYINAFMDTTNFLNSVTLYPTGPDFNSMLTRGLQIPRQPFIQKYELNILLFGSDSDNVTFYNYADTVPTVFSLPDQSYYSLNATQADNFSVSWPKGKPTSYTVTWATSTVHWSISASTDSTSLHPLSMFTALHSKLLSGQNLNSLALLNFSLQTVQGFDYAGFLGYVCDSMALKTRRVGSLVSYNRTY
jgi:hypothetical protein